LQKETHFVVSLVSFAKRAGPQVKYWATDTKYC